MPRLRMGRLVEWRTRRFAILMRKAGLVGNPSAMASRSVKNSVRGALVACPLAGAAALLVSPWLILLLLVPLAVFEVPELQLRDMVAQRKEGVERELPFFSVVVSVLASAGTPLYTILVGLAGTDAFSSMRRESQIVKRDVTILGMNPIDSLERLASNHPSARFGDFILGYASKVRSGGDVATYLSGESGALLRGVEEGWARYVARVGIIGSMMITAFGVVPLLLMVVGVFSPAFSIFGLLLFTAIGVPLITAGLLVMAGRMQPVQRERIEGRAAVSLLVSLLGFLPGVALKSAWLAVAGVLLTFLAFYGVAVRQKIAEGTELEEGLTIFLKDILEYKRQEYDLARAVAAVEADAKFNPRFKRLLSRVAAQLRAGVPLDEVKVECENRMWRLVFLVLGQMSRSGGGTVDTVYQVSSFAERMRDMKRSAAAEMKPYLILSYVSPLLLAFGVTFVGGVLSSFSKTVRPALAGVNYGGFQIGVVPPLLNQVSDLLIVVSAASLGLIGAKITDLTVKNTLKGSVNVALAVSAIVVMGILGSHSLAQVLVG